MRWSWKIAEIKGIGIFIHFTFVLLLGWVLLLNLQNNATWPEALKETLFILLVFAIVVLHELGHALAAERYGIMTRDITLLPIGGVARLERMPDKPGQELVVALAGPAVNVFLAAAIFLFLLARGYPFATAPITLVEGSLLPRLLWVNIWLVAFNMLPAFPMDGGRVLRALLAMRMDYVNATQLASGIGQAMALFFGFVGLLLNPLLIFVALFVWIGAEQEASLVRMKASLEGIPVRRAMISEFHTLAPTDNLQKAAEHVLSGFQHDFPVVEDGKLVGILTRGDLLTALARRGEAGLVQDEMKRTFETADPSEMLERVMSRLQECECRTFPVVRDGQLEGMITMENLAELLMIQDALRARRTRQGS